MSDMEHVRPEHAWDEVSEVEPAVVGLRWVSETPAGLAAVLADGSCDACAFSEALRLYPDCRDWAMGLYLDCLWDLLTDEIDPSEIYAMDAYMVRDFAEVVDDIPTALREAGHRPSAQHEDFIRAVLSGELVAPWEAK